MNLNIEAFMDKNIAPVSDKIAEAVFYPINLFGADVPIIIFWILAAGLFFTFYLRGIALWGFRHSVKMLLKPKGTRESGEVSSLQALMTALSGTIGLGSIAGVAISISMGGPGAAFWIIIGAILGMSLKFAEVTLAVKYRRFNPDGSVSGGPMHYILHGLTRKKLRWLVVVYKVDRLTRSLMDFSKIVEVMDGHETSFVSVTQHFNTTTSMGRLTLNILLSFAQFEREVTGERIRDKVAASKKKGMWMGGCVPIGYIRENKKLAVDEEQAEKVRGIFEQYLGLGSVPKLKEHLEKEDIKTRTDKPFSKGQLYHILSSKIYVGKIIHKDKVYDGEHQAIIDEKTFEATQKLLLENRVDKDCNTKAESNSVLASKIFDDKGNRMSPSHSNTRGRKYRYYVSLAVTKCNKTRAGSISKIPAGEIEKFVIDNIKGFLQNKKEIQKLIKNLDVADQNNILEKLANLNYTNPRLIRGILDRVTVSREWIEITLCKNQIQKMLQVGLPASFASCAMDGIQAQRRIENFAYCDEIPAEIKTESYNPLTIKKDIRIATTSRAGSNAIIISGDKPQESMHNANLIRTVIKSHYWNELLLSGKVKNMKEIQKLEDRNDKSYIKDVLNLRFLSPEITEAILNGTQPKDLTVRKLFNIKTLDWQEQRRILKFA